MVHCPTIARTVTLTALMVAALVSASCGPAPSSSQTPDPYQGFVTADPWDTKYFSAQVASATQKKNTPWQVRCDTSRCYPVQLMYSHGQEVYVYNLVQVNTSNMPKDSSGTPTLPLTISTINAYDFPTNCSPGGPYDIQADAYTTQFQYPIFDKLPIANTAITYGILPIVAVRGVGNLSGNVCNDIKTYESVGADNSVPGKFGAVANAGPPSYSIWVPNEESFAGTLVLPDGTDLQSYGWFKGLQLGFVRGGAVPLDATGTQFAAQDGVLVNPPGTGFNSSTDRGTVLLPYAPGDPNWTPIVRVHNFTAPSPAQSNATGATAATDYWKGVCNTDPNPGPLKKLPLIPCGPNDVDLSRTEVAAASFQTLFLAVP